MIRPSRPYNKPNISHKNLQIYGKLKRQDVNASINGGDTWSEGESSTTADVRGLVNGAGLRSLSLLYVLMILLRRGGAGSAVIISELEGRSSSSFRVIAP